MKINGTKTFTILIPLMVIIAFALFRFYIEPRQQQILFETKKQIVREIIYSAMNILDYYYDLEQREVISRKEAQARAKKQIRLLRYGELNKDYIWINDMQPRMVMHPYRTELDGTYLGNYQDSNGRKLFSEAVSIVSLEGEGYIQYGWQKNDNRKKILEKLSFVKGFKPWNWILGTGLYLSETNHAIEKATSSVHLLIYISFVFILLLISIFIYRETKNQRRVQTRSHFLRSILNNSNHFTGLIDIEGRIKFINNFALKMMGVSEDKVIGKYFWDTPCWNQFPEKQELIKKEINKVKENKTSHFELSHIDKDGNAIFLDFSMVPLKDKENNIRYIIPDGKDISEEKRIKRYFKGEETNILPSAQVKAPPIQDLFEREELQTIQDSFSKLLNITSLIADTKGNAITTFTNPDEFCDPFYNQEDNKNSCIRDFCTMANKNEDHIQIKKCPHRNLWHAAVKIKVLDETIGYWIIGQVNIEDLQNETTPVSSNCMSFEDFERICNHVGLICNIISKLAEKTISNASFAINLNKIKHELKQYKNINQKIDSKAIDNARMVGRFETATEMLYYTEDFIRNLKRSLTKSSTQLSSKQLQSFQKVVTLLNENKENLTDFITSNQQGEKILPFLNVLHKQLQARNQNIQNEFDHIFDKVETMEESMSNQQNFISYSAEEAHCNIEEVIKDAVQISHTEKFEISIISTIEHHIKIKRTIILQILTAILSNAKVSLESGKFKKDISIHVTIKEKNLIMKVEDTGIGMSQNMLENIFKQGFSGKRRELGLNLYYSLKLAKSIGGNITANSTGHNNGSTFIITIPIDTNSIRIAS